MSDLEKMNNTLYFKNNLKRNFPVKLNRTQNSQVKNDIQKYLIKSKNYKQAKKENSKQFFFNKNNISKSTFYSKTNSSIKYDNKTKFTLTEMNYTFSNLMKNKNKTILLTSLFKIPNTRRKSFNSFMRAANNSISINKDHYKLNETQNISRIFYPKIAEEKNNKILITNTIFDSEISNIKNDSIFNNVTMNNISNNKIFKKNEKYTNLEFFLKDKFYADIKEKFNKHFKEKKFEYDNSLKDKIIKLNQVNNFWGGVFSFVIPIISNKKYKFATKLIEDRKKFNEKNKNNSYNEIIKNYYSLSEKKNYKRKIPYLLTDLNLIRKKKKIE